MALANNSIMGTIQETVRAATGTSQTFQGDLHAYFDLAGIPAGQWDGRLLAYARQTDPTIGTAAAAYSWLASVLGTIGPVTNGTPSAGVSGTNVTITWTSSQAGYSRVQFGTTASYTNQVDDLVNSVASHSVVLTASDGLASATLYHYRVGTYASGAWTYSADATFTTA